MADASKLKSLAAETALGVIAPNKEVLGVFIVVMTTDDSSCSMQLRDHTSMDQAIGLVVQSLGACRAAYRSGNPAENYAINLKADKN